MGYFFYICSVPIKGQLNLKVMLNYEKLMLMNPTSYGKMTNSIEQEIEFLNTQQKAMKLL
jgi:hypothetical protein